MASDPAEISIQSSDGPKVQYLTPDRILEPVDLSVDTGLTLVGLEEGESLDPAGIEMPVRFSTMGIQEGASMGVTGVRVDTGLGSTSFEEGDSVDVSGVSVETGIGGVGIEEGDKIGVTGLRTDIILPTVGIEGPYPTPWTADDRTLDSLTGGSLGYVSVPDFYLNFDEPHGIPKRIKYNWQRGTEATYWDGSQLRTAAPNEPRVQVDPETGERYLLAEPQRTNVVNAEDGVGGDGGFQDPSGSNNAHEQSGTYKGPSFGINSLMGGGVFVCSIWLKYISGNESINVKLQTNATQLIRNDTTANFTDNEWHRYFCGPYQLADDGSYANFKPITEGASTTFRFWGAQVELGRTHTSLILGGKGTTRAPDDLSDLPFSMQSGAKSVYFRISQEANGYAPNEGGNVTNAETNLTDAPGTAGGGLLRPSTGILGISASGWIDAVVNSTDEDLQGNSTSDVVDGLTIQPDKSPSTDGAIYRIHELVAWEEERSYSERRSLTSQRPQPWQELDPPNINTLDTLGGDIDWSTLGISEPPHLNIDIPRFGIPAKMRSAWERDTVATYWDANGVLQTAAPGEPRVQHDPVTGDVKGVLGEPKKTNNIDSRQPNGGSWFIIGSGTDPTFTNGLTGIDGTSNATKIEDTDGTENNGASYRFNFSNSLPNAFTLSIFIKKDSDTSRFPRVDLDLSGGSFNPRQSCQLNTSDGSALSVGQNDGIFEVTDVGGWWKVELTVNNGEPNVSDNSYGNTSAIIRVYPARSNDFDADNKATGSIIVDAPQLERHNPSEVDGSGNLLNTYSTMPILGGVTRDRDDLILPLWFVDNSVGGYFEIFREGADFSEVPRGNTTSNEHQFAFVNATDDKNYGVGLTQHNTGFAGSYTNENNNLHTGANNTDNRRDAGQVTRVYFRPDIKESHPAGFTYILRRMFLWSEKLSTGSGGQLKALFDHDFSI